MKYESEKLGNHLDISSNYQTNNKKVILKQIKPYRTDFYQCEDGKFRFVTVRYTNVSYHKAKGMYVIDEQWYKQEKANNKAMLDKTLISTGAAHGVRITSNISKRRRFARLRRGLRNLRNTNRRPPPT